jgi:hypothetical protein
MRKLKPTVGDVWRFEDKNFTRVVTLTGRSFGDDWCGVGERGEVLGADPEEVMLSDPRWTLVRPAGCPEGFVPCSRGCGRWTRKFAHEWGDWCYRCLNVDGDRFVHLDWAPPAERRIVKPAVTTPAAVSPAGLITIPALKEHAARLKEVEESLGAFQRAQCGVNDSVMVSVKDIDRRLEALEALEARSPPPSPQIKACWAVGPGNSRCLRDIHGDDGRHRFGITLGFRS